MATTTTTSKSLSPSSTSTPIDTKAAFRQPATITLSTLPPPPVQSQSRIQRTTSYCKKVARNVVAMATGEAPAEIALAQGIETPEFLKTIQEAWDKVEDKYAVSSLALAGVVALWGSTGMIEAIDSLPLVPSVLELVGVGYTGWFAYRNLIFKRDREALVKKIKDTYKEIIGSS